MKEFMWKMLRNENQSDQTSHYQIGILCIESIECIIHRWMRRRLRF